jgi:hypothetical protein
MSSGIKKTIAWTESFLRFSFTLSFTMLSLRRPLPFLGLICIAVAIAVATPVLGQDGIAKYEEVEMENSDTGPDTGASDQDFAGE